MHPGFAECPRALPRLTFEFCAAMICGDAPMGAFWRPLLEPPPADMLVITQIQRPARTSIAVVAGLMSW